MISRPLIRATNPSLAIGQLGGHVKRGVKHPRGQRTGKTMALVSALPLAEDSELMVLTFLDRSDPLESFDNLTHKGDNALIITPKSEVFLSVIHGVCPGDWKGFKVAYGEEINEPVDLDVDATGLDMAASDAWVDMVDELGCDCTKIGGYPLWANGPMDIDRMVGRPQRFHHRITSDLTDFKLGDGGVVFVFVDEDGGDKGSVCWQQAL